MKSISVIEAKFLRSGNHFELTKLWKDISNLEKNKITSHVNLLANEIIALVFLSEENYWWLITNQQLIISHSNNVNYLPYSEISDIGLSELFDGEKAKHENVNVNIYTPKESLVLRVEQATWPAVYEILKFLIK